MAWRVPFRLSQHVLHAGCGVRCRWRWTFVVFNRQPIAKPRHIHSAPLLMLEGLSKSPYVGLSCVKCFRQPADQRQSFLFRGAVPVAHQSRCHAILRSASQVIHNDVVEEDTFWRVRMPPLL